MPSGVGGGVLGTPPVKPAEGSLWAFINGAWQPTNTVTAPLTIDLASGNGLLPATGNPDQLVLTGANSTGISFGFLAFNSVGSFNAYRVDGPRGTPAAVATGSQTLSLLAYAWDGSAFGLTSAITTRALNTQTTSDHSGTITFRIVPSGSTSLGEVARFTSNLLVGTTTDITGTGGLRVAGTTASTSSITGAVLIGDLTAGGTVGIGGGVVSAGTSFRVNATKVVGAQITGYGTPTGGANQGSFAAGSITLPNLAAGVAQLILDLKTHGLLGT